MLSPCRLGKSWNSDKSLLDKTEKLEKIYKKNYQKIKRLKKIHKNLKIFTVQKVNIPCKIESNNIVEKLCEN